MLPRPIPPDRCTLTKDCSPSSRRTPLGVGQRRGTRPSHTPRTTSPAGPGQDSVYTHAHIRESVSAPRVARVLHWYRSTSPLVHRCGLTRRLQATLLSALGSMCIGARRGGVHALMDPPQLATRGTRERSAPRTSSPGSRARVGAPRRTRCAGARDRGGWAGCARTGPSCVLRKDDLEACFGGGRAVPRTGAPCPAPVCVWHRLGCARRTGVYIRLYRETRKRAHDGQVRLVGPPFTLVRPRTLIAVRAAGAGSPGPVRVRPWLLSRLGLTCTGGAGRSDVRGHHVYIG